MCLKSVIIRDFIIFYKIKLLASFLKKILFIFSKREMEGEREGIIDV